MSLNNFNKFIKRDSGFTLIEALISIGMFSIVVSLAVGGYAQALRTQHQLEGVIAANSNASLAIEQMSREIRTGRAFCDDDLSILPNPTNPFLASSNCDPDDANDFATATSSINFKNTSNTFVQYAFAMDVDGYGYITRQEQIGYTAVLGPPLRLTASNVNVEYLTFVGSGWGDNAKHHARVTILVGISSKELGVDRGVTKFQTTVSSRGGGNSN